MNNNGNRILKFLTVFLLMAGSLFAQHRGDNLAFQGLTVKNDLGIRAMAMAGAYTSISGDLNTLFTNPAGLADLTSFQISLSGNKATKEIWENQVYRPNRLYVTLPFYLEGLYVPDPANNGILDSDLALDSAYVVRAPEMGKIPTSKGAAEWSRKSDLGGFNSLALAYPLGIGGQNIVLAGAYSISKEINDFDRNDTYLDPHIGSSVYNGFTRRQDGSDTLNVNWYRYLRQRDGQMHNVKLAAAYKLNDDLHLAAGVNYSFGDSKDLLQLNKVGYFGMIDENEFFFMYDTLNSRIQGKSNYSQVSVEVGVQYKIGAVSIGIHVESPSKLTRKWDYTQTETDTSGTRSLKTSGTDKLTLPAKYNLGISFQPAKAFVFSFDYGFIGYSSASFDLATSDTTHRNWQDQQSVRIGVRVQAMDYLRLMAGYRNVSQVFVPDGAAYDTRGPESTSWTMGASLSLGSFGRIDAAYELRSLSYYDSYYSNTNYASEKFGNLAFGYTYLF